MATSATLWFHFLLCLGFSAGPCRLKSGDNGHPCPYRWGVKDVDSCLRPALTAKLCFQFVLPATLWFHLPEGLKSAALKTKPFYRPPANLCFQLRPSYG
jgi:hypothetical protein